MLLLASMASAQQDAFLGYLKKGIEFQHAGQFDEAISCFANARRLNPKDWRGHTFQAITIFSKAVQERDPRRREQLVKEAEALQGPLIKEAGMLFQSPLRFYLMGLASSCRADTQGAFLQFKRAWDAKPELYERYESMELRRNVRTAYSLASLDYALVVTQYARYEEADRFLLEADKNLSADHPRRMQLHEIGAIISEGVGNIRGAIRHIEKCIEYQKARGNTDRVNDHMAEIAMFHLLDGRIEEAQAQLAKLPPDARSLKITHAHGRLQYRMALREPERAEKTLAYYRKAMQDAPKDRVQLFMVEFADLVLANTTRRNAEERRPLLEETRDRLEAVRARHPECPAPYFLLQKVFALLGDEEKSKQMRALHIQKEEEFKAIAKYTAKGKLRCATTTS
ncbi:MAG: hypothetical protein AAGD14_13030 [Planctomycetota bacterium]